MEVPREDQEHHAPSSQLRHIVTGASSSSQALCSIVQAAEGGQSDPPNPDRSPGHAQLSTRTARISQVPLVLLSLFLLAFRGAQTPLARPGRSLGRMGLKGKGEFVTEKGREEKAI